MDQQRTSAGGEPIRRQRGGPPRVPAHGRSHDVSYAPTTQRGRVGGDVHAVCRTPYGTRLLIADVRGKGDVAAGGAEALLAAFHAVAASTPHLRGLVEHLEKAMLRHAVRRPDAVAHGEHFATAAVAEISRDGATLRLLNRGHPAPLLLRAGDVRALEPRSPALPLGLSGLAPGRRGAVTTLPFPTGATLLLLTDGVTEARNAQGTFYDPLARLAGLEVLRPAELVALIRRDVGRHVAGQRSGAADDMALLAVRGGTA